MSGLSVLKSKINLSYFSTNFHKFILIVFSVLAVYTYLRICENFDNVRLFFNNTDQCEFKSLNQTKTGEIKLVTRHPKKISFIVKSADSEVLKAEDFNIFFDEISDICKKQVIFFENEEYLVLDFPSVGVNVKNKVLHYSIQSDKALIKVANDNEIIQKQSGSKLSFKLIAAAAFIPFLLLFLYLLICSDSWKIETKFLVVTLSFGLILIFARPPCSFSDELKHFDSAYNMSNMFMGLGNARTTNVLLKRQCDTNLYPDYYSDNYLDTQFSCAWYGAPKDYYRHFLTNVRNVPDTSLIQTSPDKVLPPQRSYFFAALVITLMRLIGVNQFVLFYSGAIVNFLLTVFLLFFSIKKNKFLPNNVIVILCSFPVVLVQLGSYSYDAMLLSVAFAIVNFSIDFYYSKNRKISDLLILIALCLFVLPIKAIYFLLSFYLLITYFLNKYKNIKCAHIVCLLFVCYIVLYIVAANVKFSFLNSRLPAEGTTIASAYSVSEIILHPVNDIKLLINSLIEQPYNKLVYFFLYGNFWNPHARIIEYLIFALFVFMFLMEKNSVKEFHFSSFIIFMLVSIFIYVVGMTWTKAGSPFIWGVQPKYFMPVLPLLFISSEAVRTDKIAFKFQDVYDFAIVLSLFNIIHEVFGIYVHHIG